MKTFTESVVAKAINLGGNFYLPYRPHYNVARLLQAYPEIKPWVTLKKKHDPDPIFNSKFFGYVDTMVSKNKN